MLFSVLECATGAAPVAPPRVAAQMYVWLQYNQEHGQRLEDHLDEAFAATERAGFTAVQGWLSWFATPEQTTATTTALAAHHLRLVAAYADGPLHDSGADAAIARILERATRAREHGVITIVMNPDVRRDGEEKTDEELAVQAGNLDRLGGDAAGDGSRARGACPRQGDAVGGPRVVLQPRVIPMVRRSASAWTCTGCIAAAGIRCRCCVRPGGRIRDVHLPEFPRRRVGGGPGSGRSGLRRHRSRTSRGEILRHVYRGTRLRAADRAHPVDRRGSAPQPRRSSAARSASDRAVRTDARNLLSRPARECSVVTGLPR